jgi:haloalkane dehalogenase
MEVDGQLIHDVDEGSGPTLLLVHAGPAWSFVYRDVILRLRERFRCVALDLPGSGLSPRGPGYRPTRHAASRVLEAVGESFGWPLPAENPRIHGRCG